MTISVVLAEDQLMVLGALSTLLGLEADITVAGTARDGAEAVRLVEALRPDVLLTDIEMPRMTGLEVATEVRRRGLQTRVVILTTFGVGAVVHALLPGVGWAAALAIGAVVAPPDAVAATSIGRRIGLPRRVVTILEGESLLNDATALVALNTAIAAIVSWKVVGADFEVAELTALIERALASAEAEAGAPRS